MIGVFWIIAGLLAVGVLLLLLPPLLRRNPDAGTSRDAMNAAVYRDQLLELEGDVAAGTLSRAGYEEARSEIEQRLLEDVSGEGAPAASASSPPWRAAIAIGVPLPIVAFAVYFLVGSPQVMLQGGADTQAAHSVGPDEIRAMVGRLAARMEKEPGNVEGWIMLGRSYTMLEQFGDAARAYANAVERSAPDAALLADYADALAMAQGRNLAGEPEKILQRALAIDPRNVKALALAGTAAFDQRDYAKAVGYWERIVQIAPADSELARSVRGSIEEARELAGATGQPARAPAVADAKAVLEKGTPVAAAGTVSGLVELAPSLAAKAASTDTVFVFARAADGPRMPLAIMRAQVRDLPLKFSLDDSSAMAPGMNLTSHKQVIVGARVSKSGNAMQQPGDLEGHSASIDVGASDVRIVINRQVP